MFYVFICENKGVSVNKEKVQFFQASFFEHSRENKKELGMDVIHTPRTICNMNILCIGVGCGVVIVVVNLLWGCGVASYSMVVGHTVAVWLVCLSTKM